MPYFTQENDIVYCKEVAGLLRQLGAQEYEPQDWCLFIDRSKRSINSVLLHNGNLYGSVPPRHSTTLKEKYDEIKFVLEKISYKQHQLILCSDLKMVGFLLGLQKICLLLVFVGQQGKNRALDKKNWSVRSELIRGSLNVLAPSLVERSIMVFPPLGLAS